MLSEPEAVPDWQEEVQLTQRKVVVKHRRSLQEGGKRQLQAQTSPSRVHLQGVLGLLLAPGHR